MTMTQTAGPFDRAFGAIAAAIVGLFAMVFVLLATLAVASIGIVVGLAALAMRLAPRRRRRDAGPPMLEGRRTPDGWVAEVSPR